MKRLCAWCGRELEGPDRPEDSQVTHGVCPSCRAKFFTASRPKEVDSSSASENLDDESRELRDRDPKNELAKMEKSRSVEELDAIPNSPAGEKYWPMPVKGDG